jgi:hypothetical protein
MHDEVDCDWKQQIGWESRKKLALVVIAVHILQLQSFILTLAKKIWQVGA